MIFFFLNPLPLFSSAAIFWWANVKCDNWSVMHLCVCARQGMHAHVSLMFVSLNEYLFQNTFTLYVSCGRTVSGVALPWQPWAGRMFFDHMYASYQQDVAAKSSDQGFRMWLLSLHFFRSLFPVHAFVSFSTDFIRMPQSCRLDCSFTSCCAARSCLSWDFAKSSSSDVSCPLKPAWDLKPKTLSQTYSFSRHFLEMY